MNTKQKQLSADIADVRVQALLQAVSDQRNSALNEVANLKGEVAILTRLLSDQIELNKEATANQQVLVAQLQSLGAGVVSVPAVATDENPAAGGSDEVVPAPKPEFPASTLRLESHDPGNPDRKQRPK